MICEGEIDVEQNDVGERRSSNRTIEPDVMFEPVNPFSPVAARMAFPCLRSFVGRPV